jgi:hypothetical protein
MFDELVHRAAVESQLLGAVFVVLVAGSCCAGPPSRTGWFVFGLWVNRSGVSPSTAGVFGSGENRCPSRLAALG